MIRLTTSLLTLIAAFLVLDGCGTKEEQKPKASQQQPTQSLRQGPGNAIAGIRWTVPDEWKEAGQRPMRVATYAVPAAEGDAEGGECAVFYFGEREGGALDANINRWVSQFENPTKPKRATKEVNGMHVTTVEVSGTYLAPAGPMMRSEGKKENYRLLGAIVEAPEGSVFFKFTGPAKTVSAAADEFNDLIESIRKQESM